MLRGRATILMGIALGAGLVAAALLLASRVRRPAGERSRGATMMHTNRLIHEKSPYLLQHAHNPVDWYPWGPEAFERAKRDDRPIFLSVGYSTCYWCHVMERESFENEEIAGVLNEQFIAIKVDREERPDIDQVYMNAVQALTGRGGWPMSVFLTPDGRPFAGGTYFPPARFRDLLGRVSGMYRDDRPGVDLAADRTTAAVESMSGVPVLEAPAELGGRLVSDALNVLHRSFDAAHGGFGTAPKFPPHNALSLLFHEYRATGDSGLLQMAVQTLEKMALGGVHDQVGGGFHRYSTDAEWLVPHFEKMLYDNALLLGTYVEAYQLTQETYFREVAEGIAAWAEREMTGPEGAFYSALDAESEGVEGKFYLWSEEEIIRVLGEEEGRLFGRVYGVREEGNYREEVSGRRTGANILHLARPVPELAADLGQSVSHLAARMAGAREKLLDARGSRARPHRDDKIIASWNGLMIAGLACAGRVLDEPRYIAAAERAAAFVLSAMTEEGRLLRRWREGEARFDGYLEDYAYLAGGLLELHEATGDRQWLVRARELMDTAVSEFWDDRDGGFFYTAGRAEPLFVRPKDPLDHPLPSGNGAAARALLRLSRLTGETRYFELAEETLRALAPWMVRAPFGTETLMLAAAEYLEERPAPEPGATAARVAAEKHPVKAAAGPVRTPVSPGDSFVVELDLEIAEGWHINSHEPRQSFLIPTTVSVTGGLPIAMGEIVYPAGRNVELAGDTLAVYSGALRLVVPLTVASDAAPGKAKIPLRLRFQACDDSACLAPEVLELAVPIEVAARR